MTYRVTAAFLLLFPLACGDSESGPTDAAPDAGPSARDLDGLWLMTSLTLADETGEPRTLRRDDVGQSIRGDVVFTSAGETTGTIDVRQALLDGGLLADEVRAMTLEVTVEADRWLMSDPDGGVIVVVAERDGDHLTLDLAPDDPRLTSEDPPLQIVLDRVEPWSTAAFGNWALMSMSSPHGDMTAGACTEVEAGTNWAIIEMAIDFDERLLFERTMTLEGFSDDQCTSSTGSRESVQRGMAEEVDGETLSIWGLENGTAEFIEFALAKDGDDLTLTRTSCLPSPACESEAPFEVVVSPAP